MPRGSSHILGSDLLRAFALLEMGLPLSGGASQSLQHSLGSGSLQLSFPWTFYHIQGNFLCFTLRCVLVTPQNFETLYISPSKHTHTCPLVSPRNWRHSPNETHGMCFSCSLSKGSCAVWRQSRNRWVRHHCKQGMQKCLGTKRGRVITNGRRGVNTLWWARQWKKQGSREKRLR